MNVAARAMLAVISVSALIGLAACGSTAADGAAHPASAGVGNTGEPTAIATASAGVPLCAAAGKVDKVVVSRVPALSASSPREVLPGGITVNNAPRVRALAAGLCALPLMPRGLVNCPADFGGAFRLVFAAGRRGFSLVSVQGSGCRIVTGVGPARSWSRSPRLKQLLDKVTEGKAGLMPGSHPGSVPTG